MSQALIIRAMFRSRTGKETGCGGRNVFIQLTPSRQLNIYLRPALWCVIEESQGCVFIGGIYELEFYHVSIAK